MSTDLEYLNNDTPPPFSKYLYIFMSVRAMHDVLQGDQLNMVVLDKIKEKRGPPLLLPSHIHDTWIWIAKPLPPHGVVK